MKKQLYFAKSRFDDRADQDFFSATSDPLLPSQITLSAIFVHSRPNELVDENKLKYYCASL